MLTMSTPMCDDRFMQNKPQRITKKNSRQYHHGNLRETLINAGLRLIEKKGVRALTLREIGVQVGVSRMAAYRHFRDKADLLGSIREAGFELFADALQAACNEAGKSSASRLKAMARAYVRFAAEHGAHYEVMFSWAINQEKRQLSPSAAGARAFGILEETIRMGQQAGEVRSGDSVLLARMVWSQVHGISMLRLAVDLRPGAEGRRFVDFCSEVLQTGLAAS
jgi:AcrR family transcriptional regulator